ncbi:hypothetical protein [Prevotella sp. HCN-7019]|uniref:hypothetical protein n=1 Tax=Prevotella sp. HCN-7019 TaxID=3134668 RepID=UPI0030C5FAD5
MKHFTKLFVGILFLILGGTQSGMAQTIHEKLLEKAVSPADVAGKDIYVFLYNVDKQQFVHGGGKYGMQTVLSDRGIRFKVLSAGNSGYYLQSAIYNEGQGACMAVDNGDPEESDDERNYHAYKTFLDRKNDQYAVLRFESVRGTDNQYYLETTVSGYKLYYHYASETDADTGGHGYVHVGGVFWGDTPDEDKDKWCLIKREDYNTILGEVSLQGRYNITGLIGNSRFLRNVSDANNLFWSVTNLTSESDYCTTIDPNLGVVEGTGNNYALTYGAFGCLEIGAVTASEDNPVEFYQTITGLKPGLYMVEAQAFFDKNDYATYKNGAYNTPNTTGASNAYLFANGEETLIPILNEDDQKTFEGYVTEHDGKLTGNYGKYFRRNVPAAYFLAKGDQYEPDESFHRVRVYVNVGVDGTLKLGVNKKGTKGRVYVDNFGLYFIGNNEIGLDAYQRDVNEVDQNTYFQPYPFHLSRKFVLNAWNAITLPCDVTGSQITETFGEDAKLCKLEGVNPQNKDQILFSTVDLFDNYDTPAIVHGECYLIWVTKGPVIPEGEEYTFLVKKENDPNQTSQDMTFPYGNIYTITGVSCPEGITMVTPEQNYKTVTTSTGTLKYTYFYHRPEYAPQYSYVMSGGKMYYLTEGNWNGLLGTCWYITDMGTSSNSKVLAIDGEGGTTDINGIVTEVPGDKAMEGVYNINGQKVADGTSLEGLPKGIYIVNGKKHVVK